MQSVFAPTSLLSGVVSALTCPGRFSPTTHGRLPPSALAILQRLSSAAEGHPAFEGSWPNLQPLGDLDLGQAAVHHAHSVIVH